MKDPSIFDERAWLQADEPHRNVRRYGHRQQVHTNNVIDTEGDCYMSSILHSSVKPQSNYPVSSFNAGSKQDLKVCQVEVIPIKTCNGDTICQCK